MFPDDFFTGLSRMQSGMDIFSRFILIEMIKNLEL